MEMMKRNATYATTTLPNGLRIGSACLPGREVTAVGVWVTLGSRHEPERRTGIAHFVEHMAFKGTARRSARRIALDIEGIGGEINALTSEDHTVYHAVVPAGHAASAADVLVDLVRRARLSAADFRRERQVILEEIQMYRENPGQHVDDLLAEALWPGHPLGRLITGSPAHLAGMDPAVLRAWTIRAHTAANTVVAVAGPQSHAEVVAMVSPLLRDLPAGRPARAAPFRRIRRRPPILTDRRDLEQAHAALGFRTPGQLDRVRFALRLLSAMLGETMGSRLFQGLRERRGLCYAVNSEIDLFQEVGLLAVYAAMDEDRLVPALRGMARELESVRARPPGRAELRRTKEYLLGQQALWFEGTGNQMHWVGDCLRTHGHLFDPAKARDALAAVTAEDVRRVAASCLAPGHGALAVVGPCGDTAALADALSWGALARCEPSGPTKTRKTTGSCRNVVSIRRIPELG